MARYNAVPDDDEMLPMVRQREESDIAAANEAAMDRLVTAAEADPSGSGEPVNKMWQATDVDCAVITVIAENEAEALREVIDQLDRPGRRAILAGWMHHGCQVVEIKGVQNV